jgi:hypothetical protein
MIMANSEKMFANTAATMKSAPKVATNARKDISALTFDLSGPP